MSPADGQRRGGGGGGRRQGGPGGSRPGGQGGSRQGGGPRRGRPDGGNRGTTGRSRQGQPTIAPQPRSAPEVDVHAPDGVRLQKLLAGAGVGSRRACEELIAAGRVQVDGQVVTELGIRVDPSSQTVHVDGERVQLDESRVYLAFNKPLGVVTTMSDDLGRPSVGDYVAERPERLFHVGRLDADTEGLLLLTNDGDLAHRLQHPRYGVLKTYVAQVSGPVPRDLGKTLRAGVQLEDGPVKVDSFSVVASTPGKAVVEIVLHEGRNHIVRRLMEEVGHPVLTLTRVQVGPVELGQTKSGRWRALSRREIGQLYKAVGL
ncbi:pseudouridine synthase [Janibacter melonis]|uniref:Pseudouridine synthase n=1 Tax=Janibacter melonis TaxID=262209 RepID=A0A176QBB0_9MICO|nr:pseudouridine synthase [Janibacter melonis]MBD5831630.1 rRNA pseudouridine synthase [Janibacter melonis]MCB5990251.1 rRNA pseudouridine synthase [Janibacter melonis]OAB87013.1 MFS transporter [Janibacter melonis]